MTRFGAVITSAVFLSLHSMAAMAQLPADAERAATSTANPARIGQELDDIQKAPALSSRVQVKNQITQNVPKGAENIHFTLNSITFDGLTAYRKADLQAVYRNRIGQAISLADLYGIAGALTNKYRNDGYILTQVIVPPQTIESGDVKLRIVEGYINDVTIEGDDQASAMNLIRKYAGRIKTDTALNVAYLERYLLLIDDLPGVSARSVLSPSKNVPGASDLRIIIERDRYDGVLSIDNFGSRYLGPIQMAAAGSVNSKFGNNERITGQFVMAPNPDQIELAYWSLSYAQPVGDIGLGLGTSVEVSASHTATRPGYDLDQFDVQGRSQVFSAKLIHPFLRSRAKNFYGHLGFDWRDVESKNNLEPTRRDRIRAARLGANYEFLDTLIGVGVNSIGLEFSQGLDLLGSSDEDDVRLTRASGEPNFTKLNADIQRLQRLSSDINLLLAGRAQWAANALLSSEEFGVGGTNFGRAYDPSEIVGDDGIAGKVELQWNDPHPWHLAQNYQLYSFLDSGKVWNQDATTSAQKKNSLSSAGLGLRADFSEQTEGGLAIAFPLTRDIQTQGDDDPRIYVNLSRKF